MDLRFFWENLRAILKRASISRLLILAGVVLALLGLILAVAIRPAPDPLTSSAVAAIRDRGVLRVAVRAQIPRFGEYSAETQSYSGLEVDIARAIARRIFGREDAVEFVPANAHTRTAKLDYGEADIALAMFDGNLKTTYALSKPYYVDAHAVMVLRDTYTTFEALDGKRVGVLQSVEGSSGSQSQAAIAKLCDQRKINYTFVVYASYGELKEALNMGLVDAIALEAGIMQSLYDNSKVLLDEAVSRVPYCAVARQGNDALIQVANDVIEQMRKDGELHNLTVKWGLPDFST